MKNLGVMFLLLSSEVYLLLTTVVHKVSQVATHFPHPASPMVLTSTASWGKMCTLVLILSAIGANAWSVYARVPIFVVGVVVVREKRLSLLT